MSTSYIQILLRRTAVALATVAGFAVSLPVLAQNNLLKKSSGETICTYTQMAVTPSGGIVVTCDGVPPVEQPVNTGGVFTISGPSSLQVSTSAQVTINRTSGTVGDTALEYTVTGGCTASALAVGFPNGHPANGFQLTAPSTSGGSCVITLGNPDRVGVLGSPSILTVLISAVPVVQPPTNGCPTPPSDTLDYSVKLSGADILRMSSGRIASSVLPGVKDNGGTTNSGQIVFGESTVAPRSATVEISINKCRGVIDQNAGFCYSSVSSASFMKISWIEKPVWGASTDSIANAYKLCRAYQTDGPYYINVRYTFGQGGCLWGEGTCGFVNQWNYESF